MGWGGGPRGDGAGRGCAGRAGWGGCCTRVPTQDLSLPRGRLYGVQCWRGVWGGVGGVRAAPGSPRGT